MLELKNREYYMTHDVRPPFTYATLIRQVNRIFRLVILHSIRMF
jgi:hypothetical protein